MADRTIRTVLELRAGSFVAGARQAAQASRGLSRELGDIARNYQKFEDEASRVGSVFLGIGTAGAAGLGLATKAAIDWESAWAGVAKTVDGTPQQMADLEASLRGLAKELPATHEEIAAVAEAAGQLGIARDDITEFTRVMIGLGEATNLSADEAATAIAQFSNVMGTSTADVDNFASALVALGNDGASTEKDILMMAQRLSGTGALIGASEQDILGLSSALSDVGISAEAGGGSISRVLQKINTDVLEGGEALEGWARVAGVSAEEFAAAWRESPIEAFQMFTAGLDGVTASGGNAIGVLSDLGIKSSEETRAVLSLASAHEGLAASLETSNKAWDKNTALADEVARRYETTESRIRIAANSIVDAGISIGSLVLPALAGAADGVASLAGAFASLPGPVQGAVLGLGGIVTATGLLGGAALKAVPAVMDTVDAFRRMRQEAPGVASALTRVGTAAARTASAIAGFALIDELVLPFVSTGQVTELDAYAAALLRISDGNVLRGIQDLNAAFTDSNFFAGLDIDGLGEAYDLITDPSFLQSADNVVSKILSLGQRGSSDMEFVNREWSKLDQTLATMASSGDAEAVKANLEAIQEAIYTQTGQKPTIEELLEILPETNSALDLTEAKAEGAGDAVDGFGSDVDAATDAVAEQNDALQDLNDTLKETQDTLLGARGSARDYEQALRDANDAIKENGENLDISTEKGAANEAALDGIADAAMDYAVTQSEIGASQEEVNAILADGRQNFIDTAVAMGMSTDEAAELADQLGLIPDSVQARVTVDTDGVQMGIDLVNAAMGLVDGMEATATVDADTAPANARLYGFDQVMDGATAPRAVTVTADTLYAESQVESFLQSIQGRGGTVTINGDTYTGQEALDLLIGMINSGDGTVTINGETYPAEDALSGLLGTIMTSSAPVTMTANTGAAEADLEHTARPRTSGVTAKPSTGTAESSLNSTARNRSSTITAHASTGNANAQLNGVARSRTAFINVVVSGASAARAALSTGPRRAAFANGGWLRDGRSEGGWVPGPYPGPGIDNTLWPVRDGSVQPLAGTEFVVNGASAQQWGPALEAINSGLTPGDLTTAFSAQSLTAAVDSDIIGRAVSGAVAEAMRSTTVMATVTDEVAARLVARGGRHLSSNGRRTR